jgi:hypothetical protein
MKGCNSVRFLAAQRKRRERDRLCIRSSGTTNGEGANDCHTIAFVNGYGDIPVLAHFVPCLSFRRRCDVATCGAIQFALLDVARIALICDDGDEIRGALLVCYAVGLLPRKW